MSAENGGVGQPSAVLLSRNTDWRFKVHPQSVELDGELCSPHILAHKRRKGARRGGEGGWSKNTAREVPFIVLRPYLGHSNAFAWKINENVWQFSSISCESLTNHSLIAPFFAVSECLFSFDEASGKNHFQIKLPRSCELPYL